MWTFLDFPGGLVVKTQCLYHRGCGFHLSFVKLRSHMPCSADKNLKRQKKKKKRMCSRQNNAPVTYIKKKLCRETMITYQIGIDPKACLLASLKEKKMEPPLLQPSGGFKLSVVSIKK